MSPAVKEISELVVYHDQRFAGLYCVPSSLNAQCGTRLVVNDVMEHIVVDLLCQLAVGNKESLLASSSIMVPITIFLKDKTNTSMEDKNFSIPFVSK